MERWNIFSTMESYLLREKEDVLMDLVKVASSVDKNVETFNQEQSQLLKTILNERFFEPWQLDWNYGDQYDVNKSLRDEAHLELYITSTCNQACEYCYLYNNPGIYPPEFNKKSTILHNLKLVLDYALESHYHIPVLDLFSGEIWHSEYGLEVLDIIYDAVERGLWIDMISIPSNCSFIRDDVQMHKIQRIINKFKDRNVRLAFSISVEGAVLEDRMRPLVTNEHKTQEFYNRLFAFAQHNDFYFHPMVASASAKDWIENYKWWTQQCQDFDMNPEEAIMMLEVRNNDWTDESITDYCKFLNFLIDTKL